MKEVKGSCLQSSARLKKRKKLLIGSLVTSKVVIATAKEEIVAVFLYILPLMLRPVCSFKEFGWVCLRFFFLKHKEILLNGIKTIEMFLMRFRPLKAESRCYNVSVCSSFRRILLNYAVFNPDMGYCQGMSDLVAPLLTEIQDESDTFWCFVGLMENTIFISSPRDEDIERQLVGGLTLPL